MIRKLVVVLLTGVICLLGITSALAVKYNEAPMLRTRVAAGELPPVEERLPEEPLVLPVRDKIGTYGGTVVCAGCRIPPVEGYHIGNYIGQTLLTYAWGLRDEQGTIVSNIAKGFEVSEDSTEFTVYLRKGLKWSDGHPFTTEDIDFAWNYVVKNDSLTPAKPSVFMNEDGSLIDLKVIDDYTFQLINKETNAGLLGSLCVPNTSLCLSPKHYLRQFHPDFVGEKELKDLVKKEGFNEWFQLFLAKTGDCKATSNPEKPRLQAWIAKKVPPDNPPWVWERNPYFWAVDEQGNQLPYIDRFENTKVAMEVQEMRSITGESQMTWVENLQIFAEVLKSQEEGKVRLVTFDIPSNCERKLVFNQTSKDSVLRQIFRDKRFRVAASHAINREEISQLFYMGTIEPQQVMPPKGSRVYEATKDVGKKYTEYDPEESNRLLDEMGLDKRDSQGYRLRPDGKPFALNIATYDPNWLDTIELMASYLREVGLNAKLKLIDMAYFQSARRSNELDVWATAGDMINPNLLGPDARWWVPIDAECGYAPEYGRWVATDGIKGEEPTGDFMANIERWRKLFTEPDPEKRLQLAKEIVTTAVENLWIIGTLETPLYSVQMAPNIKNVPARASCCWNGIFLDVYRPETYFFEE